MSKFLGCPYPIDDHARGYFHTQNGLDQIKSDLLALLLTNQNERVMLPQYGSSLRKYLFENNTESLKQQIKTSIDQQLRLFEPRVVINNISITTPVADDLNSNEDANNFDNILLIKIEFFDPENIKSVEEITLELPI